MSLEKTMLALKESVDELTALLKNGTAGMPKAADKSNDEEKPTRGRATKKTPAKKGGRKKALSYEKDVKPVAIQAMSVENGRRKIAKLVKSFGVAHAPDVEAADLPALLAGLQQIIDEAEDE